MPYALAPDKTGTFRSFVQSLRTFYKRLEEGRVGQRIVLVYGDDDFLVGRVLRRVRDCLIGHGKGWGDVQILDRDEVTADEVADRVLQAPRGLFQVGKRLFVVRWFRFPTGSEKEAKKWAERLISLPPDTNLLIGSGPLPPKTEKVFSDYFLLLPVLSPKKDRDVTEVVRMLAQQEGVEISEEAAQELVLRLGPDLRQLATELERLILLVGERKGISADVVKEAVPSIRVDVFRLMDAVSEGRGREALEMLARILLLRESPVGLLYLLARQWRFTLQARWLLDDGFVSEREIEGDESAFSNALARLSEEVRRRLPKDARFNLLDQPPWMIRRFFRHALSFRSDELVRGIDAILQAEREFKTGGDPQEQLFVLICQLCRRETGVGNRR